MYLYEDGQLIIMENINFPWHSLQIWFKIIFVRPLESSLNPLFLVMVPNNVMQKVLSHENCTMLVTFFLSC